MDELVTFNSDDEFDNFQTEMVDLQDETEYDGIVVEGWKQDARLQDKYMQHTWYLSLVIIVQCQQ